MTSECRCIRSFRIQFQGGFAPTECQVSEHQPSCGCTCARAPGPRTLLLGAHGCIPVRPLQVLVGGCDNSGTDAAPAARSGAPANTEAGSTAGGAERAKGGAKLAVAATVYPGNNNDVQVFELPAETRAQTLKLLFVDSADMFGRIVVYLLDVLGT